MSITRKMKYISSLVMVISCLLFAGCKSFQKQKDELKDTADRGTIYVSADESFKPIIDEQVQVYESQHPATKIIVHYKPEAECLKDLFVDSIRMVIATRSYNQYEKEFIADTFKTALRGMNVARDAVAVIVHPEANDTFTMNDIRDILKGTFKKNLIP